MAIPKSGTKLLASLEMQCFQVLHHTVSHKWLVFSQYSHKPLENTVDNIVNVTYRYVRYMMERLDTILSNIRWLFSAPSCDHFGRHGEWKNFWRPKFWRKSGDGNHFTVKGYQKATFWKSELGALLLCILICCIFYGAVLLKWM